jgi:hypothetical protein
MGFSYSMLASALWPMVALVVPEYQLGTAYGMWVNSYYIIPAETPFFF